MEETEKLLLRLKEEKTELIRKRRFLSEHNFKREEAHVQYNIDILEDIIWKLEDAINVDKII